MERWKDIEGMEGKYQISSQGRIRCMPHYVKYRGGYMRRLPMKVLERCLLAASIRMRLRRRWGFQGRWSAKSNRGGRMHG